jgi:hypothetical protein
MQPADGLCAHWSIDISKHAFSCAQATTLQRTVATMQMSTFLQFQSGSNEVLKTDVAVHSGTAAAWAEPLQLQALDNEIVVRFTVNLQTPLVGDISCTLRFTPTIWQQPGQKGLPFVSVPDDMRNDIKLH